MTLKSKIKEINEEFQRRKNRIDEIAEELKGENKFYFSGLNINIDKFSPLVILDSDELFSFFDPFYSDNEKHRYPDWIFEDDWEEYARKELEESFNERKKRYETEKIEAEKEEYGEYLRLKEKFETGE